MQATYVSLGWAELVKIMVVGGLGVAIFNKMGDALLARFNRRSEHRHQEHTQNRELDHKRQMLEADQKHQRHMQQDLRDHEALTVLQEAHFAARDVLLDEAAAVENWLHYSWGDAYGLDADWVPEFDPKPLFSDVTQVLAALHGIKSRHPTRSVRERARNLAQEISGHYGSIYPEWDHRLNETVHRTGTVPSEDQFRRWTAEAERLVEAMHVMPTLDEIRPTP